MPDQEPLILGVDPGTAITGYGLVSSVRYSHQVKPVAYGCITTDKNVPLEKRLYIIYQSIDSLLNQYHPTEIAVEELFFNKNSKTAISVGEARGVVMLCAAMHSLPIYEYTPLEVKKSVVGYGRASKEQVIYMVQQILSISEKLKPDDVADALAVALCRAFRVSIPAAYV